MNLVWTALLQMGVLAMQGCQADDTPEPTPSTPPTVPKVEAGMATIEGRVLSMANAPIVGATVTAIESGASTMTDGDGHWSLTILGDSTVTFAAEMAGFAKTLSGTLQVAKGGASNDLDLRMVETERMDHLAMLGGRPTTAAGAMAVEVRSLSGACDPAGGHLTFSPSSLGRVVYGKPGEAGTADETLTEVQGEALPHAWVTGLPPPGFYYQLGFDKPGCKVTTAPVEQSGRLYAGRVPIQAGALSQAILFVE
jgi:hypothetical protein